MAAQPKRNWIGIISSLCKIKITSAVTVTTAAGYSLGANYFSWSGVWVALGVFLMACGSSALNEIQEWRTDALMLRTRNRPLPKGIISRRSAFWISASLLILGGGILARFGWLPAFLGIFSVFWYNGVYTYLKRITVFAVIPGALIGAIPPAIGWTAVHGAAFSYPIAALCLFLFLWQIPHFWLLSLAYADDYRRAGFPTIPDVLNSRQIPWISILWIVIAALAGSAVPVWGLGIPASSLAYPFYVCALALAVFGIVLLSRNRGGVAYCQAFVGTNVFALVVVLCVFWIGHLSPIH